MIHRIGKGMSLQKQLLIWVLGSLLTIGIVIQIAVFWYTYQKFNASQEANLSYIAELIGSRATVRLPRQERKPNNRSPNRLNPAFQQDAASSTSNTQPLPNQAIKTPRPETLRPETPTPNTHPPTRTVSIPDNATSPTLNEDDNVLQYQSVKDGIQVDIIPARFGRIDTQAIPPLKNPHLLNAPVGFSKITIDNEIWKVFRKDTPRRIVIVRQPIDWQKKVALQSAWQSVLPILLTTVLLLLVLPLVLRRVLQPIQLLAGQMAKRHGQDLRRIELPKDSQNRVTLPSELMPLVDEINSLLLRVDRYIQSQNRFIADAAHELRSPLTAISLQVQQLQKYSQDTAMYTDPNRQEKFRSNIEKLALRVQHNQHLVEQLLTLARVEAQQSKANQATDSQTELMPVLHEAIKLLFPIADSKDQHLAIDNRLENSSDNHIVIDLDETALFMLLKNLLQNAILYTPNSGQITVVLDRVIEHELPQVLMSKVASDISASYDITPIPILKHTPINTQQANTQNKTRIIVQVIDTGIGIEPDQYHQVFHPFVRLNHNDALSHQTPSDTVKKSTNTTGQNLAATSSGTGLGLSIVYQICQQAKIDIYLNPTQRIDNEANQVRTVNHHQGLTVTLVF